MLVLTKQRLEEVFLVNDETINREASALLPPEWKDPGTINALALARWLVQEMGLEDGFRPGVERVEAMLDELEAMPPREAMDYMILSDSGDPTLTSLPGNREDAAIALVQALADKLVASGP